MGYDLSLTVPVMHNVYVDLQGMTYNINRLLRETRWVGLKLKDLNGFTAAEAATVLRDVFADWNNNPERYRAVEISDWGSLSACQNWLFEILNRLDEYPDAIFEVS